MRIAGLSVDQTDRVKEEGGGGMSSMLGELSSSAGLPPPPLIRIKPQTVVWEPPNSNPPSVDDGMRGGVEEEGSLSESPPFQQQHEKRGGNIGSSSEGLFLDLEDEEPTVSPSPSPHNQTHSPAATQTEVEEAVLQVVQVFSKPQPDRDRLFKAVFRAVVGELTIKESSTCYGFATSTMHPYVHRARALLGDKAPPMKSNRIGLIRPGGGTPKSHFKFPPHLQVLKPKPPTKSRGHRVPPSMTSGYGNSSLTPVLSSTNGAEGLLGDDSFHDDSPIESLPVEQSFEDENFASFSPAGLNAVGGSEEREGWEEESGDRLLINEDPPFAPHTFTNGSPSVDSAADDDSLLEEQGNNDMSTPEDAAREAMETVSLTSDQDRMQLFLAMVRCLNGEIDSKEAASLSGLAPAVVKDAVDRGRTLLGFSQQESGTSKMTERQVANTVEEAVRKATRCSHYQGSDRERLYLAVLQTVLGELPLTQAAATHSVPFSTLHPYVKKAKMLLGLSSNATLASSPDNPLSMVKAEVMSALISKQSSSVPGITATGKLDTSNPTEAGFRNSLSGLSISPGSLGGKDISKLIQPRSRIGGSGGRPQRDELPQFWKDNPHLMREGVRKAVQSCQYDDPSKKERLCSAVIEALLGKKTMKAAAAMHDVPFTTLQTYFHRSRAQLQREAAAHNSSGGGEQLLSSFSDSFLRDEEPLSLSIKNPPSTNSPKSIPKNSPESIASSSSDKGSEGMGEGDVRHRKRPFPSGGGGSSLDLWSRLKARQEKELGVDDCDVQGIDLRMSPLGNGSSEGYSTPKESTPPPLPPVPVTGASKRKPKKVIHHDSNKLPSFPPTSGENNGNPLLSAFPRRIVSGSSLTQNQSSMLDEELGVLQPEKLQEQLGLDENACWLQQGDESQVFGANNQDVSDYLRDIMGELGGGEDSRVHVVVPMAPEEDAHIVNLKTEKETLDEIADLKKQMIDTGQKPTITVEEAVIRAIKNSQYDGTDRDRLREAVLVAVKGDKSMKEASRMYSVPLGTFHTYYHRAKNLLEVAESGLDPDSPAVMSLINNMGLSAPAKKRKEAAAGGGGGMNFYKLPKSASMVVSYPLSHHIPSSPLKKVVGSSNKIAPLGITGRLATDDEVAQVVAKVIKNSQYPPEQKLRLQRAVTRVIKGDMTINAAANVYQLPSSTVHPYVHRTRAVLGEACPPQAKLTKVANLSRAAKYGISDIPEKVPSPKLERGPSLSGVDLQKEIASSKAKLVAEGKYPPKPTITPAELSLEDADKVVTELVKSSLYNEEGRQRLYEAILMVVTESATCSEASRAYNIPPSTIQPYVQRARVALNLPLNGSNSSGGGSNAIKSAMRKTMSSAPKVYAAPGNEATYEEVEDIVKGVVQNSVQTDNRRDRLYTAVLASVSGRKTIKDSCTEQNLPASTVHPYVSRARHMLGERCPPPKITTLTTPAAERLKNFQGKNRNNPNFIYAYPKTGTPTSTPTSSNNTTPITTTSTPDSTDDTPSSIISNDDQTDQNMTPERADPPLVADSLQTPQRQQVGEDGSESVIIKEELKSPQTPSTPISISIKVDKNGKVSESGRKCMESQLKQLLSRYNYRGDRERLVKAIANVVGDGVPVQECSFTTGIAHTTLATYVRIARQFVKFEKPEEELVEDIPIKAECVEEVGLKSKISSPLNSGNDPVPAKKLKLEVSSPIKDPATDYSDPKQKEMMISTMLVPSGKNERIKSILRHLVSNLYRRGVSQQSLLIEAVQEVVLERKGAAVAISSRPGIGEHAVTMYVEKVKNACKYLDEALPLLFGVADGSVAEEKLLDLGEKNSPGAAKKAKKSLSTSSVTSVSSTSTPASPPVTPTRTSRRLQEKAKDSPNDPPPVECDVVLNEKLDHSLAAFLKRLHYLGFPITNELVYGVGEQMGKRGKGDEEGWSKEITLSWADKYRQRHSLVGNKMSQ